MSAFEFVLILVAIVAGFAISEILATWGRLIRARVPVRQSALFCMASLLLLSLIVRYVWLLWLLRDVEWHFVEFVLRFSPMLVLALAAYVIALPRETVSEISEHYFEQARPYFILLALFIVLWSVADLTSVSGQHDESLLAPVQVIAWRMVAAGSMLVLAHTISPALHWLLLAAFAAGIVALSVVAVPQL